jgi:hypothetical protein
MQCIYLLKSNQTQECIIGMVHYKATENDIKNYCESNNFLQCPRLISTMEIKKINEIITVIKKLTLNISTRSGINLGDLLYCL